jgi:hypothetical protein
VHTVELVAAATVEYNPASHALHSDEPGEAENLPAAHSMQASGLGAASALLNFPASHGMHKEESLSA